MRLAALLQGARGFGCLFVRSLGRKHGAIGRLPRSVCRPLGHLGIARELACFASSILGLSSELLRPLTNPAIADRRTLRGRRARAERGKAGGLEVRNQATGNQ